jgi:phosphorylcholine metabolism protein LicD
MLSPEKRKKMLLDIKEVFDKNQVDFFPIHGTLLGFVREQRIIPYDADADLGAWYTEYDKIRKLYDTFLEEGYRLIGSGMKGKYRHLTLYRDNDDLIDKNIQKKLGMLKPISKDTLEINDTEIKNNILDTINELGSKKYTYYLDYHPIAGLRYFPFHVGIDFFAKDKDAAVRLHFYDNNLFDRVFGKFEKRLHHKFLIRIFNFFKEIYRAIILYIHVHETYPYTWFETLKPLRVYDVEFKIPIESEKYLDLTYSNNWKVPDKNYTPEKWNKNNRARKRYKIRDKNILDLWLKRDEVIEK